MQRVLGVGQYYIFNFDTISINIDTYTFLNFFVCATTDIVQAVTKTQLLLKWTDCTAYVSVHPTFSC